MKEALPISKTASAKLKSGSHELLNNNDEEVNRKGGEILTDLNFQCPNYSALCAIKSLNFLTFILMATEVFSQILIELTEKQ